MTFDQNFRTNRIESAFVRMGMGVATTGQIGNVGGDPSSSVSSGPSGYDIPLRVVRAMEDWQSIPVKGLSGFPQIVFLDTGYPVATLHVWPAPSSAYEIHILILNPLIRFDTLNIDINLPDEYQDGIFWNLCRRLRNAYGKPMDPEVNVQAGAALNTIKNANFQLPQLRMPADLTRNSSYNIYTDSRGG